MANKALIAIPQEKLAEFCRENHILKLSLFGSVLHGNSGPESDIDLLVEFKPAHIPGLFRFAHIERQLSELIGRKVDLRTPQELSRYFRDEVLAEAEVQYAEG